MLADALATIHAANLGPMAQALEAWVADAQNQRRSHTECVTVLAEALLQHRLAGRCRSFQRRAVLPASVSLADVHTGPSRGLPAELLGNLGGCDWVRAGHTVVVTGPTQSGKSFLATALAQEAVAQRLSTEYVRVPDWLASCADAPTSAAVNDRINAWVKPTLLVLDDFATEQATLEESYWLRRLLDRRQRTPGKATLVASPVPMEAWDSQFACPLAADALVSRCSRAMAVIRLQA
jgi:DNA replication protein DnaC